MYIEIYILNGEVFEGQGKEIHLIVNFIPLSLPSVAHCSQCTSLALTHILGMCLCACREVRCGGNSY